MLSHGQTTQHFCMSDLLHYFFHRSPQLLFCCIILTFEFRKTCSPIFTLIAAEPLVMTVYILTASWCPDASLPTVKPEWDLGIRCHILQNNIYCTSLGCYTYIFNLHRWVVIHLPYCSKLWNLSLFYLARFFPCPYMVLWFFPC